MGYRMKAQYVFENIEFERGIEPKEAMGIGRRALIEKWINSVPDLKNINKYKIDKDLIINVRGDVFLSRRKIIELPEYIQFGKVIGDFWISGNGLISLRGCPRIVTGYFSCTDNNLTSLEGGPKLASHFLCYNNKKQFTEEEVRKECNIRGRIEV